MLATSLNGKAHAHFANHIINKNGGLRNEMGQTGQMGIGGCACYLSLLFQTVSLPHQYQALPYCYTVLCRVNGILVYKFLSFCFLKAQFFKVTLIGGGGGGCLLFSKFYANIFRNELLWCIKLYLHRG